MSDKRYIVFKIVFDEAGIQIGENIHPDNQFNDLNKATEYAAQQKKNGVECQIIANYQSNPKKIVHIIQ